MLLDRRGHQVLRQQLGDGAGLAFGRSAVVGADVEDEGVVEDAQGFQLVDDLAVLGVGVLQETGVDLHQAGLEGALFVGHILPALHAVHDRRQLGLLRNPAQFLLLGERLFAQRFPAVVELAAVLVRPVRRHMMRAVDRAGRKVEEERLVRVQGPVGADVADGVARQVFGQVIIIGVFRLDGRRVAPQRGSYCEVSPAMKP